MEIKEFRIVRYGPLENVEVNLSENFNLLWGKNEDGKTLTIDALVKLLIGKPSKDFKGINRVDENPEGYVVIKTEDGKEVKLSRQRNLTKISNLTAAECNNVFIIRNSELSIAKESEFYANLTDKLTGLRTQEILKIKNALREIGKITESGAFRDDKESERLKTRIEKAKHLIEKIEHLIKDVKERGFDELEEKVVNHREEIERIEQEIKNLEEARKREKYEKGKDALEKLKESLKSLAELEIYNEEEERLWRDCERDIKNHKEQRDALLTELKEKEEAFKESNKELSEAEREFQLLDRMKGEIDEIELKLRKYKQDVEEVKKERTKSKFYVISTILSALLLSISMIGLMMKPLPAWYGLIVLFTILTGAFAVLRFLVIQKEACLNAEFESIRLICSKLDIHAESIEEVYSGIQRFKDEYERSKLKFQEIKKQKEDLEKEIERLREYKIPEEDEKLNRAKRVIDEEIRKKTKTESLEEYSEKLKLKRKNEKILAEQVSVLRTHFGEKSKDLSENIFFWSEEIESLVKYKDKAKGIKYDERHESNMKEQKRKLEGELEKMRKDMEPIHEGLEAIEREAKGILQSEDEDFQCKTSIEVENIKERLQRFVKRNEHMKEEVLEVIKIFEDIEKEEREKISELFGKESSVSKYFREITDGLYEEVTFEQEREEIGRIKVKRTDGIILEAEKLSGGAYDQLYFSIRLALGEKLLKDKRGFFIMDDPFIKSDPDRLQKQMDMLKKISESGWQIIYFSAKGEVKEALKKDIENRLINYVKLPGIFS